MHPKLHLLILTAVALVEGRHLLEDSSERLARQPRPWFCHDLDCPTYKVIDLIEPPPPFELREYEGGKFASTTVLSYVYLHALTVGLKRINNYISGKNVGAKHIAKTYPVLVKRTMGSRFYNKNSYECLFWLPPKFQDAPPVPTDPVMKIITYPTFKVAVLQSGGYIALDLTITQKVGKLKDDLFDVSVPYNAASPFIAGYDPPLQTENRHNEIWIPVDVPGPSQSAQ